MEFLVLKALPPALEMRHEAHLVTIKLQRCLLFFPVAGILSCRLASTINKEKHNRPSILRAGRIMLLIFPFQSLPYWLKSVERADQ